MKKEITNKELLNLYKNYNIVFKRFIAQNKLYSFDFSLREFEYCHNLFSEYDEVIKKKTISKSDFVFNSFLFRKLSILLKIENELEVMIEIIKLYNYALIFINEFQKRCLLCTNDKIGFVPLTDKESRKVAEESKYKNDQRNQVIKNKGTFKNYFYEWFPPDFTEPRTIILKYIDSMRSNLIEHGDTIEMIYNRDFVISLFKHYEYLSKGIQIEQSRPK